MRVSGLVCGAGARVQVMLPSGAEPGAHCILILMHAPVNGEM